MKKYKLVDSAPGVAGARPAALSPRPFTSPRPRKRPVAPRPQIPTPQAGIKRRASSPTPQSSSLSSSSSPAPAPSPSPPQKRAKCPAAPTAKSTPPKKQPSTPKTNTPLPLPPQQPAPELKLAQPDAPMPKRPRIEPGKAKKRSTVALRTATSKAESNSRFEETRKRIIRALKSTKSSKDSSVGGAADLLPAIPGLLVCNEPTPVPLTDHAIAQVKQASVVHGRYSSYFYELPSHLVRFVHPEWDTCLAGLVDEVAVALGFEKKSLQPHLHCLVLVAPSSHPYTPPTNDTHTAAPHRATLLVQLPSHCQGGHLHLNGSQHTYDFGASTSLAPYEAFYAAYTHPPAFSATAEGNEEEEEASRSRVPQIQPLTEGHRLLAIYHLHPQSSPHSSSFSSSSHSTTVSPERELADALTAWDDSTTPCLFLPLKHRKSILSCTLDANGQFATLTGKDADQRALARLQAANALLPASKRIRLTLVSATRTDFATTTLSSAASSSSISSDPFAVEWHHESTSIHCVWNRLPPEMPLSLDGDSSFQVTNRSLLDRSSSFWGDLSSRTLSPSATLPAGMEQQTHYECTMIAIWRCSTEFTLLSSVSADAAFYAYRLAAADDRVPGEQLAALANRVFAHSDYDSLPIATLIRGAYLNDAFLLRVLERAKGRGLEHMGGHMGPLTVRRWPSKLAEGVLARLHAKPQGAIVDMDSTACAALCISLACALYAEADEDRRNDTDIDVVDGGSSGALLEPATLLGSTTCECSLIVSYSRRLVELLARVKVGDASERLWSVANLANDFAELVRTLMDELIVRFCVPHCTQVTSLVTTLIVKRMPRVRAAACLVWMFESGSMTRARLEPWVMPVLNRTRSDVPDGKLTEEELVPWMSLAAHMDQSVLAYPILETFCAQSNAFVNSFDRDELVPGYERTTPTWQRILETVARRRKMSRRTPVADYRNVLFTVPPPGDMATAAATGSGAGVLPSWAKGKKGSKAKE